MTAESSSNAASACSAVIRASVVLPVPGGPYRTIECGRPDSIAVRSAEPAPSRCSWPTNSSSVARPHAGGERAVERRRLGARLLRLLRLEQLVHAWKVASGPAVRVPLVTVLREWGRLGVIGFGGPPAHVALLRELVVERRGWISAREFEDANAACQLLPGPGSTQLAIYCGQRVGGIRGALVGGFGFIVPGLLLVLAIAALALGDAPPEWIVGVGAGAGGAVVAVIVQAGIGLGRDVLGRRRAPLYMVAGFAAVVLAGPYVVLVLIGSGLLELAWHRRAQAALHAWPVLLASATALPAVAWTALKVGALSYGGGFVTIPLMQADAVDRHGWMTDTEFLNAVAFGQLTPGPVTHTVALVGWAADGLVGRARGRRGRVRAVVPRDRARRRALRPPAREPVGARVPRRRRPGGGRRDPRQRRAARRGAAGVVAGRGARRRRARAAGRAAAAVGAGRRRGGRTRGGRRGRTPTLLRMDLQAEATDVLSRLIRFDTVNPPGNERACQEWLKGYLEDGRAGVRAAVGRGRPSGPTSSRGCAARPTGRSLGYLSHVDTVLADAADWRHDPWSGAVHDGAIWGRGAIDMKSQTAAEAVAVAHLARPAGARRAAS